MTPWTLLVHLIWVPSLFVLFLKVYRGPYPLVSALLAYFLGALMTVPALGMQLLWNLSVPETPASSILEMPLWSIPIEEGAKVFAALLAARFLGYAPPRRCFLPLAIAAALGFAAAETAMAVVQMGPDVLPLRTVLSVPAHVIYTTFAAAGLAGSPRDPIGKLAFLGWWSLSVAAHLTFNGLLTYFPDASPLEAFQVLAVLGVLAGALATLRTRLARRRRALVSSTPLADRC